MKTDTGKFESSKNALTHGLTAANIARFPDSIRDAYASFFDALFAEWQPATANEEIYFERYAFSQFQLLRAQSLLATAQEDYLANPNDEAAEKRLAKLTRHYRGHERSAQAALKELRTLIADRLVQVAAQVHLSAKTNSELSFPPVFPHHLITEKKSLRAPLATNAVRFAAQHITPDLESN
jgi:hypothetical protein